MKLIDRLVKIKTVDDIDEQISLAKQYARRLRAAAQAKLLKGETLIVQGKLKEAESTLRKLRMRCFDIEDAIVAGNYQPQSFNS
ncbi:MAG: hypothetical protein ABNH03_16330 [Alteromonas sp.]|jgi:hypothetical protein|uniref:hypothetical protein n=1 Tax=Alteromonas sp. TaxID=232 RepID=UPI0030CD4BC9|tara:strand:- start:8001 stop:8252 length:252 start_codon:yes stop_codon:yes gene_type:complete